MAAYAALMHSIARQKLSIGVEKFLPRDAMHKRGYLPVTRCLSVRLSVTFMSCAKMNKDIFEIF